MLTIDQKDAKRMAKDLRAFTRVGYPHAVRETLSRTALVAQKIARDHIRGKFINRNAWTVRGVEVEKATLKRLQARVGHGEQYMRDQEFGVTRKAKAIPMPHASNETALPRRRLPVGKRKLENLTLVKPRFKRGSTRRQRNRAAIMYAAQQSGVRFVYLSLGRRSGIYRVMGNRKKPTVRKAYNTHNPQITIGAKPWLAPATALAMRSQPRIYNEALRSQLTRNRVFGYK